MKRTVVWIEFKSMHRYEFLISGKITNKINKKVSIDKGEDHTMGFYRCEANNGIETISTETVIKIHLGNKRKGTIYWPFRPRSKQCAISHIICYTINKLNIAI